jgi:hydrogenase expression/formation protein HypD
VPPSIDVLLNEPNTSIHGFILPGHVCAIIGSSVFEPYAHKYHAPMVVAGFEINDVLMAIALLLKQILAGTSKVENTYQRVVKPEGNLKAFEIMNRVFEPRDALWRGIGMIPLSGLYLRAEFQRYDAIQKFGIRTLSKIDMPVGCLCSQVLFPILTKIVLTSIR